MMKLRDMSTSFSAAFLLFIFFSNNNFNLNKNDFKPFSQNKHLGLIFQVVKKK